MTKPKHTPGPWKIESDGSITKGAMDYNLRGPGGKYLGNLCETSDDPGLLARDWLPTEEGEANCRVIAASPDLLDVALLWANAEQARTYIPDREKASWDNLMAKTRAAIAKAL